MTINLLSHVRPMTVIYRVTYMLLCPDETVLYNGIPPYGIPPYIHQASLRPDWLHGIGVETP